MNSIFTISPYLYNNQWVFDDPAQGLEREALVSGSDQICSTLAKGRDRFNLLFSADPFPGAASAVKIKKEFFGTWYYCGELSINFWLCKSLEKYLPIPPASLYFKAS